MAIVVVTGANRGIGLEFCRQFKAAGDDVIALCRKASAPLRALGINIKEGIEVDDDGVGEKLESEFKKVRIDLLINNAGIFEHEDFPITKWDLLRKQFEVNSMGPLRVTFGLLDSMASGGKIAMITSMMGSIGDNSSGGYYGYRMSKAALNIASKSLAIDLKEKEVAVGIFHPGYVRTDMTENRGNIDPQESVTGLRRLIDRLDLNNTGEFWHTDGRRIVW